MSINTKPIYEAEKYLVYMKHLNRLDSITNQRSKRFFERNTLEQMHKIRNNSTNFRNQQHIAGLNSQNLKLINKLIGISKRKYSSFIINIQEPPKIKSFNNPKRKRQQREISLTNVSLAERIMSKQSEFDSSIRKKNLEEYERIKSLMQHNKKLPLPDFYIDIKISRARSKNNRFILDTNLGQQINSENKEH